MLKLYLYIDIDIDIYFSADSFYWWVILTFKEQPILMLHNLYQNEMDSFSNSFHKASTTLIAKHNNYNTKQRITDLT